MSKYRLLCKVVTLILLGILMLIPVTMVMSIIEERQAYQASVIDQIAASTSRAQTIIGPIMVLPYSRTVREKVDNRWVENVYLRHRYFLPETLTMSGNLDVTPRNIGIYQAQVYQSDIQLQGTFSTFKYDDLISPDITLEQPFLLLSLSDTRGISQIPKIQLNNTTFTFEPGVNNSPFSEGIHVPLEINRLNQQSTSFHLRFFLQGIEKLSIVPIGRTSELTLSSNWPHPNFISGILPNSRTINEQGFTAVWQSSWFANTINDRFRQYERDHYSMAEDCDLRCLPAFSTSLIETVDQYQLNERTVKYAVLFIALTFIAFFLFEVLAQLRVHPIQYLLVGIALMMFYLILLALSERLGFLLAYIIASLACSGLIAFYLSAVLKKVARGLSFGGGLLSLYATLFIVLHSEGNALLLGTLLTFSVLSGVMVLTRRIDWYQLAALETTQEQTTNSLDNTEC